MRIKAISKASVCVCIICIFNFNASTGIRSFCSICVSVVCVVQSVEVAVLKSTIRFAVVERARLFYLSSPRILWWILYAKSQQELCIFIVRFLPLAHMQWHANSSFNTIKIMPFLALSFPPTIRNTIRVLKAKYQPTTSFQSPSWTLQKNGKVCLANAKLPILFLLFRFHAACARANFNGTNK